MGLLELPSELIASIFVFLDDSHVFAARLSNKDLEKASFSHFGKRFFRKKGFMITTPSLDVLGQIAEHQELRRYVQHIWFNPDCYTFTGPEVCAVDADEIWDEDKFMTPAEAHAKLDKIRTQRYTAYRDCVLDHGNLLDSDRLGSRLTPSFGKLANLMTVGMRRSEDYSPYGWTELKKSVGTDPRVLGPIPSGSLGDLSGPTKLFVAIINALANTGLKLERLYTDAIEVDNIPESDLSPSKLHAACSSILYIELNSVKARLYPRTWSSSPEPFRILSDPADHGSGLVTLFKAMPNLKEVGLQIFPDRKQSHLIPPTPRDPTSWKSSYPYLAISRLASETILPNLTRVKLEKLTTTSATLCSFLAASATNLTSLKIRDIRLLSSEEDPRPWQTFFTFLLTNCPNLDYILFYHIMYERGGVSFVEDPSVIPMEDEDDMLIDHVPQSHGGHALFAGYDHITLEVHGKEEIRRRLEEVKTQHWYHNPLFSYAMDEDVWHTDTSDEEW